MMPLNDDLLVVDAECDPPVPVKETEPPSGVVSAGVLTRHPATETTIARLTVTVAADASTDGLDRSPRRAPPSWRRANRVDSFMALSL
jgi:hypothetical protein